MTRTAGGTGSLYAQAVRSRWVLVVYMLDTKASRWRLTCDMIIHRHEEATEDIQMRFLVKSTLPKPLHLLVSFKCLMMARILHP
jgi:hypothetical protein